MNFNRFVGLPWQSGGRSFAGVDCYGLVWLFYREELGVTLRSYAEAYSDAGDYARAGALVYAGIEAWRQIESPEPGSVILMRRGGHPAHVGIYVPGRRMLHIEHAAVRSCIAPITQAVRARILGYFIPRD